MLCVFQRNLLTHLDAKVWRCPVASVSPSLTTAGLLGASLALVATAGLTGDSGGDEEDLL
jgi:hypothetical protein